MEVGENGVGVHEGHGEELAGLLVGGDTGIFGGSLEVKGVVDLLKEGVGQIDDSRCVWCVMYLCKPVASATDWAPVVMVAKILMRDP